VERTPFAEATAGKTRGDHRFQELLAFSTDLLIVSNEFSPAKKSRRSTAHIQAT
jgi:hypothetical protein